jgi:predicted outer membrane repeat protein
MKEKINILAMFLVALSMVSNTQGKIITVDDDGPVDFSNIQAAIDYSKEGDTIIVAEGRYYENINLWGKNIILRSTEPNNPDIVAATIIDGGQNDSVITCDNGENNNCVISGFTITNGYARGPWPSTGGGGIYCKDSAPTVMNCIFSNNSGQYGGGIFIYSYTSATVTNCTFKGNSASSEGGGLCNWFSSLIVTNCTFTENRSEYYGGGGLHNSYAEIRVVNCIFTDNRADGRGGGMFNHGLSNAKFTNCTFSNNSSGGIYSESKPILTNCILWGNRGNGIMDESAQIDSRESLVNYCCIQGLTGNLGGVGNIGYEPLFVRDPSAGADGMWGTADDDLGDLHLRCGSPCLDAGINNTDPPLPSTDLDGKARIVDSIVDMGAYEGGSQAFVIAPDSVLVPEDSAGTFTVKLECEPPGPIDVNVAYHSGDTDITISSGEVLMFDPGNFSDPQTVVLTAAEDSDQFEGHARFRIMASDISYAEVAAQEIENDVQSVLFVDADASGANDGTSWADAFNNLQDALTLAAGAPQAVDEIIVAGGIYKPAPPPGGIPPGAPSPTFDRTATFQLINNVTVKGGYAGFGEADSNARDIDVYKTILSGDLGENDVEVSDPCDLLDELSRGENSYHVVTGSGTDLTAVLDGFTITAGHADGSYLNNQDEGGGMYNESGNPTIMNCTFTENSSQWGGCMSNRLSSSRLSNCTFSYNGGRGMWNSSSDIVLNSCMFIGNSISGIVNWSSNQTLTNCTFSSNRFNGMYNRGSNSILMNCAFIGNNSSGMYNIDNSNTKLTNCSFSGNSTSYEGGGVFNYESNLSMYNCIFTGNSAENEGGGVYDLAGVPPPPPPGAPMVPSMFSGNNETSISGNRNLILINCTFADNIASKGNAIALDSYEQNYPRNVQISNCILWDGGDEIWNHDGSTIMITYSDVCGGWLGMGNIESDPCFVAPGYRELVPPPPPPFKASEPNPADGAMGVGITVDLSWRAGRYAVSHDVYFGTSSVPPLIGNQTSTTFDPGTMAYGTTYYWRIDEVNDPNTITGDIWNFTTMIAPPPPPPMLTLSASYMIDNQQNIWIEGDYHLLPGSPCIDTGDPNYAAGPNETDLDGNPRVIGGRIDMGAYEFYAPRNLYVDDDAPNDPGPGDPQISDPLEDGTQTHPFDAIQETIDAAEYRDNVIVLDGNYRGDGNRDIDFRGKAIIVRSENGPEHCIIDCNGTEVEPHRGFYFHSGEDSNSVLSGLTITNGYVFKGGGICCVSSHPTITNCIFSYNTAQYFVQGAPFSTLPPNENSSSMVNNDGEVHINVPPGWIGYGGGIYCRLSSPILTNCTFTSNTSSPFGGAMYNSSGNPSLFNCIFNCNSASGFGGGILNSSGSPRLFNCIFSGNSANYGGGMNNSGNSRPVITNCTFSGNTAKYQGGGIHSTPSTHPTLKNCIVWGNEVETALEIWGSATVSYSNVEGGWPGEGNIDADPCFVELGYWAANELWIDGDYHLLASSPCIDAGDPNYIPEPNETDLDGRPRVIGQRIDMGAYEYSPPISAEVRIVPRTINLASKGNRVACYIWLPEEYNVADIEPDSVFLESEIQGEPFYIDEQQQVATAKFSREEVQAILDVGDVELTITGQLKEGSGHS